MEISQYKYKTDLHVHTSPASNCGRVDVETTVGYYSELGFNSIVLTNHFNRDVFNESKTEKEWLDHYLNDYTQAKKLGENYGINIILGMELRFPENVNDYLIFGIDEQDVVRAYDYIDSSYEVFYKKFKNEKNVIVQAHPFRNGMELQRAELLDGIEVYNMHPGHNSNIGFAARLAAENPDFIITGGTDFHHDGHQGMCAMRTAEKISDSFQLAQILKSGDYFFDIWGDIILPLRWQLLNKGKNVSF